MIRQNTLSNAASDEPELVLDRFLPYRLSVLANTVSRGIAKLYADRFDVTVPEWRAMAVLGGLGPTTANEIARRTAMDKAQVSRAVARLIKAGRLARQPDPDDHRSALLTLTKVGRTVYNEIVPLVLEREADLLQILDATERAQLDALLAKLGSRADRII
jgi:DNA-binding MarR family transcriptional regulator